MKTCISLLAQQASPTERDVYAGRLAQETGVSRAAIDAQLEGAVRSAGRRRQRQDQRDLLKEGIAATVQLPRGVAATGKALGAAYAEQQLLAALLTQPQLAQQASLLDPSAFLVPELGQAFGLVMQRWKAGQPFELATLSGDLPEAGMALLSRILAQNHGITFTPQDLQLYIDRLAQQQPAASAAEMNPDELAGYLARLRQKKHPTEPAGG